MDHFVGACQYISKVIVNLSIKSGTEEKYIVLQLMSLNMLHVSIGSKIEKQNHRKCLL